MSIPLSIKLTSLPSIIRKYRISNRLSLSQLAKLSDIDPPHLSRIETGQIVPSLEVLEKIFESKKFQDEQ